MYPKNFSTNSSTNSYKCCQKQAQNMGICHNSRLDITHVDFQLVNVQVRIRPEILKFITKYRLHVSMHMRLSFQRLRNAPIKSSFYHTRTCLPLPCFFQGSVVYAAIYSVYTSPQVFSTKFRAIPGTEYPI